MRRYLIVAHRTLGGPHLLEEVVRRRDADGGRCAFYLLVPMEHSSGATWSEGKARAAAEAVLKQGIERFAEHGIEATGEIGDKNPVYAVEHVLLSGQHFDEILLSTLPAGPSRWLKVDVPTRLARAVNIPVTHLVAESANA